MPDSDPFEQGYKNNNLLIRLDLRSGDYSMLLGFPKWYQDGNYWGDPDHILPSISPYTSPDQVLVSFPLVDSVYLLDLETERLKPYFEMVSVNLEKPNPIDYQDRNTDRRRYFQLATDYYFSLNFDPFKKQYWRVFYKRYDDESIMKMLERKSGKANQKTVIVYDENLRRLGEMELKEMWGVNAYDLYFLAEGAFVSQFSDSIEDQLVFRQLTIK